MAEVTYSKKQIGPLIKKYAINPETNTMFNRIISLFADQTNYHIWAIKAVFGKNASIEDIEQIKSWADEHQTHIKLLIKQNIVSYSTVSDFKQLFDEMRGLDMISAIKSTIEKFNTAQRKMLSDELAKTGVKNGLDAFKNVGSFKKLYELLKGFESISDSRKKLFITKASAYTSVSALRSGLEDCLKASYDWNKEDLLGFVARNTPNAKVVYNNGDVVILEIKNFDDSHKLCGSGRTGWCITREASYFRQYVTDTGNRQYFYFDFSKKDNDELAHIGFTVNNNNGIVNAHSTRNSSMLGEGINYQGKRINVQTVLKNHGIKPSVYLTLKDLKNFKWSVEALLAFFDKHKDLYAISFSENNRIVVRCMSRQAIQMLCDHTLINVNNVSSNSNDKNYVLIDLNLPKEEDKAIVLMNYVKDRYNTYTLNNVWDSYNTTIKNENYLASIGITTDMYLQREKIAPTILLHKLIEEKNEKEAVELIAKEGDDFDVNFEFEKQTPIFLAVQNNFFDLFAAIINHKKFDYNTTDVFAETIFTSLLYEYMGKIASSTKDDKAIKALENMINIIADSKAFNFNIQNLNLDTAVNIACQYPQTTWVAEKLIANPNVDINVVNDFNCSALGCAIYGGNTDAIKLLAQRSDFRVREDDKELAKTKGINLDSILSQVAAVAVAH